MIELKNLTKSFDQGQTRAVDGLNLRIRTGEITVLLGSSGCGKTTTLKMINRLIEPTGGEITLEGENILRQSPVALRRKIGYVFQGIGLFPHMTVSRNVEVVPRLLGWRRAKRRARARELLDMVGLAPNDYAQRHPRELSGGQQQRVGVARALAADPAYLLMDEPFGALDAVTRDSLQKELLQLQRRLSKTIVFVTHDIFEAVTLADRIAVLHDGRLEQVGAPKEILTAPESDFVRELVEKPTRQLQTFQEART
ncbi:MAG: ATP-binding cassette domain-containing protein [Phycisphaerae bacterium]|nr:ATP-binding cassette domain-containing protein [Phycisphaerae bacterium]